MYRYTMKVLFLVGLLSMLGLVSLASGHEDVAGERGFFSSIYETLKSTIFGEDHEHPTTASPSDRIPIKGQKEEIQKTKEKILHRTEPEPVGWLGWFHLKFYQIKDSLFGAPSTTPKETVLDDAQDKAEELIAECRDGACKMKDKAVKETKRAAESVRRKTEQTKADVEDKARRTKESVKEGLDDAKETVSGWGEKVGEKARDAKDTIKERANDAKESVKEKAIDMKEGLEEMGENIREKARDAKETIKEKATDLKEGIEDRAAGVRDTIKDTVEGVKSAVNERVEGAKEAVHEKVEDVKGGARETKEYVKQKAKGAKDTLKNTRGVHEYERPSRKVEETTRKIEVL